MGHKCFISFKKEDIDYKEEIQSWVDTKYVDMIDKSLDEAIDSDDEDYIMRKIREDHLSVSTVTIFLIGQYSSESLGEEEQKFIKRELQASLYNGAGNTRNGILGIVLPEMYDIVYEGSYICSKCHNSHNLVNISRAAIKEFSRNYFLNNHGKCCYSEDDRYCVLVKWDDFKLNPGFYIDKAYKKRSQPIAEDVIVRPK